MACIREEEELEGLTRLDEGLRQSVGRSRGDVVVHPSDSEHQLAL